MAYAEPTIALPERPVQPAPTKIIGEAALPGRKEPRYVPRRGLVRSLRNAHAIDGIRTLAARHKLDPETRDVLGAELSKAGAPPITAETAEVALKRMVHFEPLNADALRPFIVLSADRMIRAAALAGVATAMRNAGRSVRLLSDAVDALDNDILTDAGKRLGCGVTPYDGAPSCVDLLRKTDLACLSLVETGFRAPLDKVAMLRLHTLVQATGAEPVFVMRPCDAALAVQMSHIGVKRVVLALTSEPIILGPALSALRKGNLSLAETLEMRGETAQLSAATPGALATVLVA